mmetsp:Transcript_60065/g.106902  ORF Transcript_60065/g.106902 Transcript_60065/m.106902 type:complete len:249 (+) Transcript_60065:83-829(+)
MLSALTLLLGSFCLPAAAIFRELYTTDKTCTQKRCVNPVFPALQELPVLSSKRWKAQKLESVVKNISFCSSLVVYNPALPDEANKTLEEIVATHDRRAATMYFYHLSAMGVEPWDHTTPNEESVYATQRCADSVARMACFTYFPASLYEVAEGTEVRYHKPCSSSCESFLEACDVKCCDESTACDWKAAANIDISLPANTISDADLAVSADEATVDQPRRTVNEKGDLVMVFTGYPKTEDGSCTGQER